MKQVRVLPTEVAQLIAAGEVVERPASVIKELVENAIDAGATKIRIDIESGGVRLIRITDNGCGMNESDAQTCFLRHATSKIQNAQDISGVLTLGFRGEALASIAAVSQVQMTTRTKDDIEGTFICLDGGVVTTKEPVGAPVGTSITVENLFYNTPARKKFLKTERSETGAIGALLDRLALSHPEISFQYYSNNKEELFTPGDGKLISAASVVLGSQQTRSMVSIEGTGAIRVTGLACKPLAARGNRNQQFFFINGRCITSGLLAKAVESAYAGSIMSGKYPVCILSLDLDATSIDVNVHPSKSIVKFSDEKIVFSAVFQAVSQALKNMDQRYVAAKKELEPQEQRKIIAGFYEIPSQQPVMNITQPVVATPSVKSKEPDVIIKVPETHLADNHTPKPSQQPFVVTFTDRTAPQMPFVAPVEPKIPHETTTTFTVVKPEPIKTEIPAQILCIGEIFNTYIIAQCADEVYFIDKHAAHERLIFEKLNCKSKSESQPLLVECIVSLDRQDKLFILEEMDSFTECGFEMEDYGGNAIMVRAIPAEIAKEDISDILEHAAANLADNRITKDKRTKILESMACKSAVKGGQYSHKAEQQALIDNLFAIPDIKYCPHGRPIIYTMHKKDFEKMFKRIV